jgi:hypothetical protein
MLQKQKSDPVKFCKACGTLLFRKRFNGRLEDLMTFKRRSHCSRSCGNSRPEIGKAALHKIARQYLKATCEECGTMENLHAHHKDKNISNNDPSNVQTLCASCHLRLHWRSGKTASKRQSVCKICGNPARKLDMCQKHYQRFRKYGDPCLTKRGNTSGTYLVRETSNGELCRC